MQQFHPTQSLEDVQHDTAPRGMLGPGEAEEEEGAPRSGGETTTNDCK